MEDKLISRRVVLAGGAGMALWGWKAALPSMAAEATGGSLKSMTSTPEQTEGPFYIERQLFRKDVTEGKVGVPVELNIRLVDSTKGKPVSFAAVDIWHCDPAGKYSGFAQMAEMEPPPGAPPFPQHVAFGHRDDVAHFLTHGQFPGPHGIQPGHPPHKMMPTDATTFLRGTQLTDASGIVRFNTVYPGWYAVRALHIHIKVHTGGNIVHAAEGTLSTVSGSLKKIAGYADGHVSHTGQLFFPEKISDAVSLVTPYSGVTARRMRLAEDMIYAEQGGKSCMLLVSAIRANGDAPTSRTVGYSASAVLHIDPSATPAMV